MSCSSNDSKSIEYIEFVPRIDGKLDASLEKLRERKFTYFWQFDNPKTDTIPVSFRLAYSKDFMYVYVEALDDSINYRPRGFWNGDGFKFLIAKPQKDSVTNEYYDMVFSASRDTNYWARKRIWEYNHDQRVNNFSERTKFFEFSNGQKNGYEALISWEDIPPYHPFFEKRIGYNLYFAKAIKDTITNGYAMVKDEGIWHEEIPYRKFKEVDFQLPYETGPDILKVRGKRQNIQAGNNILLEFANRTVEGSEIAFLVEVLEGSELIISKTVRIKTNQKFNIVEKVINTEQLKTGIYQVQVSSEDNLVYAQDLMVLPNTNINNLLLSINENSHRFNEGIKSSLLHKIQTYNEQIDALRSYESKPEILDFHQELIEDYDDFVNGIDPYADLQGPYRRAFLSQIDSTLQPYSIKLPKNYDPNIKYPLLVFLHGSGATDVGLLNDKRSNGQFIEIAPFGRDKFFTYSSKESQKDILEAIDDVSKYFSVDTTKIIIGGFSMGGYGSLRTFFENPNYYKGVVVHAGHPNLANNWLGGGHPNFLKQEFLEPFKSTKVFVYHGKNDGALAVAKIETMVAKMEELGIDVTHSIVDSLGHQYPDEHANRMYFNWLKEVIE